MIIDACLMSLQRGLSEREEEEEEGEAADGGDEDDHVGSFFDALPAAKRIQLFKLVLRKCSAASLSPS